MEKIGLQIYEVNKKNYHTYLVVSFNEESASSNIFKAEDGIANLLKKRFYTQDKSIKINKILDCSVNSSSQEGELEKIVQNENGSIFPKKDYLYRVARVQDIYSHLNENYFFKK